MKNFEIKWADSADYELLKLVNQHFQEKNYSHTDQFFEQGIEGGMVLVAYFENKPAGYLIYQVLWGNTPFVALLRIMPEFRGEGLGRKLIEISEQKLKGEGYEGFISSSETINDGGKAFHDKMGFVEIGKLQMIHGEEVFYKKMIL